MSFTLKDITGAVLDNKKTKEQPNCGFKDIHTVIAYNQGKDNQSSVKIKFNREKLIGILEPILKAYVSGGYYQSSYVADAIIATDKEIMEVDDGRLGLISEDV